MVTPPTLPLRLGIIGYGWVARDYMAPAAAAHPDVALAAVASVRDADFEGLRQNVARFSDWRALLQDGGVDAVYVATPNHLHADPTVAALEAGIPVLCEKPLAAELPEAERMMAAVARTGTAYATAFDQRWHPAHVAARACVTGGCLGTVTQVRLDYACWVPADWTEGGSAKPEAAPAADNWRVDRARAGGGAVVDLAPHGLDLVEALTGQRLTRLTAELQYGVHGYGVDEGGALLGVLDGGALLVHTVGYNRPETLPRRRLELLGTGGRLLAEDTMGQTPGGHVTLTDATTGQAHDVVFDRATGPFYGQLDAFVRQVRGTYAPERTAADDLRLARLLDGALATAERVHGSCGASDAAPRTARPAPRTARPASGSPSPTAPQHLPTP